MCMCLYLTSIYEYSIKCNNFKLLIHQRDENKKKFCEIWSLWTSFESKHGSNYTKWMTICHHINLKWEFQQNSIDHFRFVIFSCGNVIDKIRRWLKRNRTKYRVKALTTRKNQVDWAEHVTTIAFFLLPRQLCDKTSDHQNRYDVVAMISVWIECCHICCC